MTSRENSSKIQPANPAFYVLSFCSHCLPFYYKLGWSVVHVNKYSFLSSGNEFHCFIFFLTHIFSYFEFSIIHFEYSLDVNTDSSNKSIQNRGWSTTNAYLSAVAISLANCQVIRRKYKNHQKEIVNISKSNVRESMVNQSVHAFWKLLFRNNYIKEIVWVFLSELNSAWPCVKCSIWFQI